MREVTNPAASGDPFLSRYDPSELRVAAEFFTTWLPFLCAGLCPACTRMLTDRVGSLVPGVEADPETVKPNEMAFSVMTPDIKATNMNCGHSIVSEDDAEVNTASSLQERMDNSSLSNLRGPSFRSFRMALESNFDSEGRKTQAAEGSRLRPLASLADTEEQAEHKREEEPLELNGDLFVGQINLFPSGKKRELPREQREYIRFMNVKRRKDFVLFERVKGERVNIVEGLELHDGIFSAAEQKRIVDYVYELQDMGRRGELKERTYTAPAKWMRGKGRETLQFGCCYNYAVDRHGNPPGILHDEFVDPLPSLFKSMIKRLVRWHVLPPACVPDSCIVNIYEEGDCIPPHIDNHDFIRPFCTVSFLSECKILFGSSLKILAPGEFAGPFALPLPVGSVLVLNGNGADIAQHCVPAVPTKRISITFRRMDGSKRPSNYISKPDLLGLEPLPYEVSEPEVPSLSFSPEAKTWRQQPSMDFDSGKRWSSRGSDGLLGPSHTSGRRRRGSSDRWRYRKNSAD